MAGVPHHALDNYLARLVRDVAEQFSALSGGLVLIGEAPETATRETETATAETATAATETVTVIPISAPWCRYPGCPGLPGR